MGVFVDQHNVSSAMEMAKLADLFYESNRRGNINVDVKRNFNSRGNQYFKPKNCSMSNVNLESSKNGVNTVSRDKTSEWVAQKAERSVPSKIRCFHCKMPNHKRSSWSQTAAKVEQLCESWVRRSTDYRQSICHSVVCKWQTG